MQDVLFIQPVRNMVQGSLLHSRVEPCLHWIFRFFAVYLPLTPQWHGDLVGVWEYLSQAGDSDILGQVSGQLGLHRA